MENEAVAVIREVLKSHGIAVADILLFGSRARKNAGVQSDWDFLVLTEQELPFADKKALVTETQRKLAALRIPNDIIISSLQKFNRMKNLPGTISSHAAREGVHV